MKNFTSLFRFICWVFSLFFCNFQLSHLPPFLPFIYFSPLFYYVIQQNRNISTILWAYARAFFLQDNFSGFGNFLMNLYRINLHVSLFCITLWCSIYDFQWNYQYYFFRGKSISLLGSDRGNLSHATPHKFPLNVSVELFLSMQWGFNVQKQ